MTRQHVVVAATIATLLTTTPAFTQFPGQVPTGTVLGNASGASAPVRPVPATDGTILISGGAIAARVFGAAQSGIVPQSGGGTANFLRADGTWQPVSTDCAAPAVTAVLYSDTGPVCAGDAAHFFWTETDNVTVPHSLNVTTNDTTGVNGAVGLNITGGNNSRGGAAAFRQTSPGGSVRVGYGDAAGSGYITARSSDGSTVMPLALNEGVAEVSIGTVLTSFTNQPRYASTAIDPGAVSRGWLSFGLSGDYRGQVYATAAGKGEITFANTGGTETTRITADSTRDSFLVSKLGLNGTTAPAEAIDATGNANVTGVYKVSGSQISCSNLLGGCTGGSTPGDAGAGLYAQVRSATPTSATTGFDTWINQGGASVADSATGFTLTVPSSASNDWRLRCKTAPSTPYTITVLLAATGLLDGSGTTNMLATIGWSDGTKLEHTGVGSSTGLTYGIVGQKWTNVTTFSAADFTTRPSALAAQGWLRIADDGTNISMYSSADGANFRLNFTIDKASGFLGSSGYSSVCLGGNVSNSALMYATILSWSQQ